MSNLDELMEKVERTRRVYEPHLGKVVLMAPEIYAKETKNLPVFTLSVRVMTAYAHRHNHFTATLILLDAKGNKSERYVGSPNDLILVETP